MAAVLALGGGPHGGGSVLELLGGGGEPSQRASSVGSAAGRDRLVRRHRRSAMEAGLRRTGIRVHRSRSLVPGDVTLRRGIPVTTPARTIADLRAAISTGRGWRYLRPRAAKGDPPGERDRPADWRRGRSRSHPQRLGGRLPAALSTPPAAATRGQRSHRSLPRRLPLARAAARGRNRQLPLSPRRRWPSRTIAHRDLELMRRGYEVLRLSELQLDEEPAQVAEVLAARLRWRRRAQGSAAALSESCGRPGRRGGRWSRARAATRSSARRRSAGLARASRRCRGRPRTRRRRSRGRRRPTSSCDAAIVAAAQRHR